MLQTWSGLAHADEGRTLAQLRRNKGMATGKPAAGWGAGRRAPMPPKGSAERAELEAAAAAHWHDGAEQASAFMADADWSALADLAFEAAEAGDYEEWRGGLPAAPPATVADTAERNQGGAPQRQRRKPTMSPPDQATPDRPKREKPMSGPQCQHAILKFWPSVYAAAPALGMTYQNLHRIVTGKQAVPPLLERVLRLLREGKITPADLA